MFLSIALRIDGKEKIAASAHSAGRMLANPNGDFEAMNLSPLLVIMEDLFSC